MRQLAPHGPMEPSGMGVGMSILSSNASSKRPPTCGTQNHLMEAWNAPAPTNERFLATKTVPRLQPVTNGCRSSSATRMHGLICDLARFAAATAKFRAQTDVQRGSSGPVFWGSHGSVKKMSVKKKFDLRNFTQRIRGALGNCFVNKKSPKRLPKFFSRPHRLSRRSSLKAFRLGIQTPYYISTVHSSRVVEQTDRVLRSTAR
jgi:hypothetical protein